MTPAAKKLTAHAKPPIRQARLTAMAQTARAFLDVLGRLGYDRTQLIAACGLDSIDSNDPDARVPCEAIGEMFGYAMKMRPIRNLGARLAAETPMGAFPLLDYLAISCDTVSDAVRQLARYYRIIDAPYVLDVQETDDPPTVVYRGDCDATSFEYGISIALLHLREETEQKLRIEFVSFVHEPGDTTEIEKILGCPVRPRSPLNAIAFPREAWNLALRKSDRALRSVLEQHARDVLARLPKNDSVTADVNRVLLARISNGATSLQSVAQVLGFSARSLQRRLSEASTSYVMLLDQARRESATQHLRDRRLSIAEVAYLLGYSEPGAFHRAFKRWHGVTPQEFRKTL